MGNSGTCRALARSGSPGGGHTHSQGEPLQMAEEAEKSGVGATHSCFQGSSGATLLGDAKGQNEP